MRRNNDTPAAGSDTPQHGVVTALARGLELLRCFGPRDEYLGNAELAGRTAIPRPTVSRMTATLTQLGYLIYVPNLEKYRLGPAVLDLGYRYLAGEGVRDIARPFMQELADATDCLIAIGAADGAYITYIQTCQGPGPLILRMTIGSRVPIATSSVGRAYLAALSPAEREPHYRLVEAEDPAAWPSIREGLERAYADYAEHGFCVTEGEWNPDIAGVGVPLRVDHGERVVAFNCGGSSLRLTREVMLNNVGPRLAKMVARVREMLVGGG